MRSGQRPTPTLQLFASRAIKEKARAMSTTTNLREWQKDHLKQALQRYDSHMQSTAEVKNIFLSEAVTGAGKTTLAVAVYAALINAGYIDGCVIVCPKGNICDGWIEAFTRAKINVSKDHNPKSDVKVVVITYAGIAGKYLSGRNAVRFPSRYLLILDEIHHAEREDPGDEPHQVGALACI